MHAIRCSVCFLLPLVLLVVVGFSATAAAQSTPGPAYALRVLDGQNDIGEYFATARRGTTESWTGFHYVADEQSLYSGNCGNGACTPQYRLTSGADRGQHVSAATRTMLSNRAFAAFYNASSGDLEAVDCADFECNFATLRSLDSIGDVGAGTATAIHPTSGLPYIAYFDVGNGDLRLYRCATAICDSGDSVILDGINNRGANPSMAFTPTGALFIAYDDSTTGELRLGSASAPYSAANFDSFDIGLGSDASITVDGSGFIDLVFNGAAFNTLQRLRCSNASCNSNTQSTLDGLGTGFAPSASRLPNGNLLISHHIAASGAIRATVCNDAECTAPQRLSIEAGPGFGPNSVALSIFSGRPLIIYRDAANSEVRTAQCTTTACTAIARWIANGIPAFSPDIAIRPDGRAVAIWTKLRLPRIGLCSDAQCTNISYRTPAAGNSDSSRPSIAIRPDGRPFAYYSYVGGSAAWDCADTDCNSGILRSVSGTGNGTGRATELAIRSDGRPVMLYYGDISNEVFLFSCADVACSSGTAHLLADEPDQSVQSTMLSSFELTFGTDGRPQAVWKILTQPVPGIFEGALRFARCDDIECTSATVRSVSTEQSFGSASIAVRDDNRPVMIEAWSQSRNLLICNDAPCTGVASMPLLNPFDSVSKLSLLPGNLPRYSAGTWGKGGYWECNDPSCTSPIFSTVISDSTSIRRSFSGRMAFNASAAPVQAFAEEELQDIWLAMPLPDSLFENGFEN